MTTKKRNIPSFEHLIDKARIIRKHVIQMVSQHGQGYIQQGLGAADLFTYLYFHELNLSPQKLDNPQRDRFILSTAHNTAVFMQHWQKLVSLKLKNFSNIAWMNPHLKLTLPNDWMDWWNAHVALLGRGFL